MSATMLPQRYCLSHAARSFATPSITSWTTIASTRPRHFASSATANAEEQDHYAVLGVKRSASRREIKDKFYELSKTYHPDAPSTSSTGTSEQRLARFQVISASYATLSDDSLRRAYDSSLSPSHHGRRARYTRGHPGYTTGTAANASSGGAYNATYDRPWSDGENERRRARANYAWAHPASARRAGAAADAASARADPFGNTPSGGGAGTESLFRSFAAREAFARGRSAAANSNGTATGATSAFGDKAEEENRLINDSSTKRTGQVFFVFLGAFALASLFSGGSSKADRGDGRRR